MRTTLPYGVAATQTGPPVSTTYPIGTYCEDYEWLAANSGDLDKYNGRFCVTPEYPAGTYAYFVTINAAGAAAFPYYIGIQYYGAPETTNHASAGGSNTVTIPAGVTLYTGGVLALRILQFSGVTVGTVNQLRWTLAENSRDCHITLARSADGLHFYDIADFAAGAAAYTYTDQKPGKQNFYRLHITNAAGVSSYSSIVKLKNDAANSVLVYPTITGGQVSVRGLAGGGAVTVLLRDAAGQRVKSISADGNADLISFDISALPRGMYAVSISNTNGIVTEKIIKK